MTGNTDVRRVLTAAERAADLAEQGWVDYVGAGPRRYAGLATAVGVVRSIPILLRRLRPSVAGWDQWWANTEHLHDGADSAWMRQLRAAFASPSLSRGPTPAHLDAAFEAELMWHAPGGTVSWFLNDALGRSGWKVRLPIGTIETVYFTVPIPVARAYAAMAIAPDGRHLEATFPRHLDGMRVLVTSAVANFGVARV